MAWNREHAGVAAAPAVAIDWSVTAMNESAGRLAAAGTWDLPRVAAALAETVWWVTLVDATLVRYHLPAYEKALASESVRQRKTEQTLEGLRYVRNELGRSADPARFVRPAPGDDRTVAWTWQPLPEPDLGALGPRARRWELARYRAYQARLAGRRLARTCGRCTDFLAQAAGLAVGSSGADPVLQDGSRAVRLQAWSRCARPSNRPRPGLHRRRAGRRPAGRTAGPAVETCIHVLAGTRSAS
jgi:hypothetical protein